MQSTIDFILELDKLKGVERKVKPLGQLRYENSAEHSWQISLFAWSLAEHAAEPVDMNRVIQMLLVHDIGEIDVGDVIAFAEGQEALKQAEREAVQRIFALAPAPLAAHFLALWDEFEAASTAEARFAHAADRAMPVLLNLANQGQSWRENGISYERVLRRIRPPIESGCPALWQWLAPQLEQAQARGYFGA